MGGDKDNRGIAEFRIGLERLAYGKTTHARHLNVQEHKIRFALPGYRQSRRTIVSQVNIPQITHRFMQNARIRGLVFDDQNDRLDINSFTYAHARLQILALQLHTRSA